MVIQDTNHAEVPDFILFCRERGAEVLLDHVINSPALSLLAFPAAQRRRIADGYLDCLERFGESSLRRLIAPLVESLPPGERIEPSARLYGLCQKWAASWDRDRPGLPAHY